jgi:hypothetical protein
MIDWSWELLAPPERIVMRRLLRAAAAARESVGARPAHSRTRRRRADRAAAARLALGEPPFTAEFERVAGLQPEELVRPGSRTWTVNPAG